MDIIIRSRCKKPIEVDIYMIVYASWLYMDKREDDKEKKFKLQGGCFTADDIRGVIIEIKGVEDDG